MVLAIECNEKELKRRRKRWKRLGFNYDDIVQTFGSMEAVEKQLKKAIGVCKEDTKKLKEKKEQMDRTYQFLTTQERIK